MCADDMMTCGGFKVQDRHVTDAVERDLLCAEVPQPGAKFEHFPIVLYESAPGSFKAIMHLPVPESGISPLDQDQ